MIPIGAKTPREGYREAAVPGRFRAAAAGLAASANAAGMRQYAGEEAFAVNRLVQLMIQPMIRLVIRSVINRFLSHHTPLFDRR
jgi:hypothetical protein